MIVVTMVFAVLTGAFVAAFAWCCEQLATVRRIQTRGIWAGAMLVMLAIAIDLFAPQRPVAAAALRVERAMPAEYVRAAPGALSSSLPVISPLERLRIDVAARVETVEQMIAAQGVRLSSWNSLFIAGWMLSSSSLLVAILYTARRDRRLRDGLVAHHVDGTPVLLSDGIGPAVVGPQSPAIVLPRWALDLDAGLLNIVMRHEREHIVARDPLLLIVGLVVLVAMPWNIPLWWCWRRLRLAIEVDCDTRVLRAYADVRRYAQLLLLVGQRSTLNRWSVSTVAPLTPNASHLARRISIMTPQRSRRSVWRTMAIVGGAAVTATVAYAMPRPRAPLPVHDTSLSASSVQSGTNASARAGAHASNATAAQTRARSAGAPLAEAASSPRLDPRMEWSNSAPPFRTYMHLTEVGLINVPEDEHGLIGEILVYADGPAAVGIGRDEPVPLDDVLRLKTLQAMTLDVTDSDVHVELVGPGVIKLGGHVSGGRATRLSASSRHIVFMKGGAGVRGGP